MTEEFVYIGAHLTKAWADFNWASIASSETAVANLLDELDGRRRAYLVVSERAGWSWLLQTLASRRSQRCWQSRVLGLGTIEHRWAAESILDTRFERCVHQLPVVLPTNELVEVLAHPNRSDFCIGGSVDHEHQMVVLVRGNLDSLAVSTSSFEPSGDGIVPDFDDFEVTDHGQTLRFGEYEASLDAVLYELDDVYRRRLNKQRRADEQTFGASLRRLRLQRKLSRDGFPGVSAKCVARIERGDVVTPQAETIQKIADRLGVKVEEIESY